MPPLPSKILIATANPGKQQEFKLALACKKIELIFPSPQLSPCPEEGKTYQENALKKAQYFFHHYALPTLSDDSGLEVFCLNQEPGLYSARYGGENKSYSEKIAYLLQKIQQTQSPPPWKAQFVCHLCFWDGKQPYFFEGKTEGEIISTPKGKKGFGYDPIFFLPHYQKTMAELDPEEKLKHSHRGKALASFLNFFANPSNP